MNSLRTQKAPHRISVAASMAACGLLAACQSTEGLAISRCGQTIVYTYPGKDASGLQFSFGGYSPVGKGIIDTIGEDSFEGTGDAAQQVDFGSAAWINPVLDCSSEFFKCIRTPSMVLAVPSQEFSTGHNFVVQGADIYFEGCIVGGGLKCRVGLFVSDCRPRAQAVIGEVRNDEISGADCRQSRFGVKVIYVYDRDRGVVAFAEADWWSRGAEDVSRWKLERLGVDVSMLTLRGSQGLLSCQIFRPN